MMFFLARNFVSGHSGVRRTLKPKKTFENLFKKL